jgi:hypothetical protein
VLRLRVKVGALAQIVVAPVSHFSAQPFCESQKAATPMRAVDARTARLDAALFPYRSTPY